MALYGSKVFFSTESNRLHFDKLLELVFEADTMTQAQALVAELEPVIRKKIWFRVHALRFMTCDVNAVVSTWRHMYESLVGPQPTVAGLKDYVVTVEYAIPSNVDHFDHLVDYIIPAESMEDARRRAQAAEQLIRQRVWFAIHEVKFSISDVSHILVAWRDMYDALVRAKAEIDDG